MTLSILIAAPVDECEKPAVRLAAERLATSLKATDCPAAVQCDFDTTLADLKNASEPRIVITSLLAEVAAFREPWAQVEDRLRARYEILCANPVLVVFICTVFRHTALQDAPDEARATRARIRQLDLLAAELSRKYGAMIIDINRSFANIGAFRLQTDYRLTGPYAAQVAAKFITLAIISAGLDEYVPFEAQDAIRAIVANDNLVLAAPTGTEITPANVLSLGAGRRRQSVRMIVDTNEKSQVGWLVRKLLSGEYGFGDAVTKLRGSLARRGLRRTTAMLIGAVRHLLPGRERMGH